MNGNAKVMEKEMHDELVGMLTAMSIVAKRLARRLAELNEVQCDGKSSPEKAGCKNG